MFKFTINGKTYKVSFCYNVSGDLDRSKGTTYAEVFYNEYRIPKGLQNHNPIARGAAFCSLADNFNRITGRKVALNRALHAMFPNDKESRTVAWNAFKDTCRYKD